LSQIRRKIMSIHPVVVKLPEDIYERVDRTAKGLKQPVQQALIKIVEAGLPSLAKVPPEYQPELEALEAMSDEKLWDIARSEMAAAQQDRLERLLQKSQAEGLSEAEQQDLDRVHAEANRLMLQKSYAHVLLKWRGHQVPKLTGP
jgi:hypothetical protein